MKSRPLHDRVVIRRITPLEKSAGGIIIPDTVQEKPRSRPRPRRRVGFAWGGWVTGGTSRENAGVAAQSAVV